MSENTTLAPDALGPTVCVGEILVEIMATAVGEGFLEALELVGPFPSGAPAIFIDQCARIGGSAAMVGAVEKRFAMLVEISDLLLPSGQELEGAAGTTGEDEVVLKRGAAGATFFDMDGLPIDRPAFAVEEVDPTAAGDCFGGAYVICRRLGMNAGEALEYANAAGARNFTFRGPMEGAGTLSELGRFMTQNAKRNG